MNREEMKAYTFEELANVSRKNPMKAETAKQITFGHRLLHWGFKGKKLKGWSFEQIVKEHIIMADLMIHLKEIYPEARNKGHKMEDDLDKTLPKELQDLSVK